MQAARLFRGPDHYAVLVPPGADRGAVEASLKKRFGAGVKVDFSEHKVSCTKPLALPEIWEKVKECAQKCDGKLPAEFSVD